MAGDTLQRMSLHRSLWRATLVIGPCAVLAACGADAIPSTPLPSTTTSASDDVTPSSTAGASSDFAAGSVVQVVADELRIRPQPGTAGEATDSLERGAVVRIEEGPTDADGYAWYRVVGLDGEAGWVAAGDASDAWLGSTPTSSAGRLIELDYGCDVLGPVRMPTTTIFDDGTVIATVPGGGTLELARLTTGGLATIRADLIDLPALQRSAEYVPVPLPGAEPPGHGACHYRFTVGPDPDPIVVRSISWFGDEEEREFYEPSPERRILDAVAANLIAVRSVLDDALWVDNRGLPYVGTEYTLWLTTAGGARPQATVEYEDLGLASPWRELGDARGEGRCAVVSIATAFRVVAALRAGGYEAGLDGLSSGDARDAEEGIGLLMAPRTPLGRPACDDANF